LSERFYLTVDGDRIVGEISHPPQAEGLPPVLCICHGIPSGAPPDPTDGGYPVLAERFVREGFLTCIFNFRGCGLSEGNLDLLAWTRDLAAVIDHLENLPNLDHSCIAIMGFSGGAATATYVAAHNERITRLVLCACPAEFSLLAGENGLERMLQQCRDAGTIKDDGFPPSLEEWGDHFREVNPIRWIDQISPRPLLIVHGDRDELIPSEQAETLYHLAKEPKELVIVPGAEHRMRTNETVIATALNWLKKEMPCP